MPKEEKQFGLRPAMRPHSRADLSAAVVVVERDVRAYCYVTFTDALVRKVGKKLPRGVAAHDPAHLMVVKDQGKEKWRVYAAYYTDGVSALLWETDTRPHWLKLLFGVKNGTHDSGAGITSTGNKPRNSTRKPPKARSQAGNDTQSTRAA